MLDKVQPIVYNRAIKKSKGDNNNERNHKDYRHQKWHRTWHSLPSHFYRPRRPSCLRRSLLRPVALLPSCHHLGRTPLGNLRDFSARVADTGDYRLYRRTVRGYTPLIFFKKKEYII